MSAGAELAERWLMPTYRRPGVEFVRGEGARLWDSEGREYLDFLAGISVCSLGHCHPELTAALTTQANTLTHVSNLFHSAPAGELARDLSESSLGGRAFLCNSGTEANECAIKLARKHARLRGVEDPEIVVLEGGFHGRTMGSLSATPGLSQNPSFAPYLEGFRTVPRDDPAALEAAVGPRTAAIMLELIQGESGVHPVPGEVVGAAREACDRAGALLIVDEIQTGMGRTGTLWAHQGDPGVAPDVMTSAKALGGGLPVGACVATPACGEVLEPGDHGSTFAGGPLVATVARRALELTRDPGLLAGVASLGERLREELAAIPGVSEVRGRGLMIGVGLQEGREAPAVAADLLHRGLIVNAPAPDTLRLLPPLVIGEREAGAAVELIRAALA